MPRTPIYPSNPNVIFLGPSNSNSPPNTKPDDYLEKLAKYVPAEVLVPYLPLTALSNKEWQIWASLIAGEVLTIGYLYAYGSRQEECCRPVWYYYLLAALAFPAWAVGASAATASVLGIDAKSGGFILGFAAFVIPLVDVIMTRLSNSPGSSQGNSK
jgi:hypothetical protein